MGCLWGRELSHCLNCPLSQEGVKAFFSQIWDRHRHATGAISVCALYDRMDVIAGGAKGMAHSGTTGRRST